MKGVWPVFVLTVQPGDVRVPVDCGSTIDRALGAAGFVRPRRGCRRGGCGMCMVRLDAGTTVDERPIAPTVLTDAQREVGMILPCRAVPTGDVEVTVLTGRVRCVSPMHRQLAERRLAARPLHTSALTSAPHQSGRSDRSDQSHGGH